jgi:SanA protein
VLKKSMEMILKVLFILAIVTAIAVVTIGIVTRLQARSKIYTVENVPPSQVAVVFGAGLRKDGSPTAVLRDRVKTAADIYFAGKVKKLLMSGDNRFVDYNEPQSMFDYAVSLGVPAGDIVLDYAGRRTYDTCYRARHIFGVHNAILVTQQFHLPRALLICNGLDIQANGVNADRGTYSPLSMAKWKVREQVATFVAWWEVWVTRPIPVLGKPEPIFPESSNQTPNLPG